jgi:hypothetical protein
MREEMKYDDEKFKRFNDSLDEEGKIDISGIFFSRSRILFEMDFEAYKQSFNQYLEQDYEDLKQVVFNSYPACIAYNFRLSEKGEGSSDPVRKLLHLKDTWEAIIFVLYALVMGELRYRKADLKSAKVFVSYDSLNNPTYASFNTDKILSDAVKQKIQNIKAIVDFVKKRVLCFKCKEVDESLLDDLLRLQDIRNDVSHHATPTSEQAKEELKQVIPLFREMIAKTRFLENCKVLRFESFSSECRCEAFNGHSLNREYENYKWPDVIRNYVLTLGQEQIFALWDSECFSLSPFIHFDKDVTGHEAYLCFYKGKKQSKYWYEPLKIRSEKNFDHLQKRFESEKDEIIKLVVP